MSQISGRDRVLKVISGEAIDSLPLMPITMMFAADRAKVSYRQYATDCRVLVDAQIRVATEFDFDYVSCISDPAREAADCGAKIVINENTPPENNEADALLTDKSVLGRLKIPDPLGGGRMHDRVKAARLFRERIGGQKLIEGWIEGPCAEGADLRGINNLMLDFYEDPPFVRDLFAFVTELEIRFARAQIDAGVDLIGIGDAAASLVGPEIYERFVWPCEKRMVDAIHAAGAMVRLHICGNTRPILAGMGRLGCDIVDLDYPSPVHEARSAMGRNQVLLGNMNPVTILRNGTPKIVTETLAQCHHEAGGRFIVGAGCEVPRDTPLENVRAMRDYARTHR